MKMWGVTTFQVVIGKHGEEDKSETMLRQVPWGQNAYKGDTPGFKGS